MTPGSQDIHRQERLQRVRIGLTGLAAVFLLVMGAGALTRSASDETPVQQQADVQAPSGLPELVGSNGDEQSMPKEPLAELGVAPSAQSTNNASEAAQIKGP